jgi:hypothetical protein
MPIDPNIALQAGQNLPQFGVDPQKLLTMYALAQRMQLQQQQQVGQNALRALYGNPGNLDQQGQPTPQALNSLMRISPETGLNLQHDLALNQQEQMRTAQTAQKISDDNRQWVNKEVRDPALAVYEQTLQQTGDRNAAQMAGQRTYSENLDRVKSSGRLSSFEARQLLPNFDYTRSMAASIGFKNLQDEQRKQRTEGREEQRLTEDTQHHRALEEQGRWIVKDDPQTAAPYMVNTKTGETKPVAPPSGSAQTSQADPSLMGEDFLKTMPGDRANLIKGIADGRVPWPPGQAYRSPAGQVLMRQVMQYDPSFSATDYNRRFAVQRAFTTGPEARNVTSFNTALGHLANLRQSADGLLDSELLGGKFKPLNWLQQTGQSLVGQDARIKQFALDAQALASEMERSFRGTGGNVTEIESLKEKMNSIDTPGTMKAVIKEASNLLASRIEAINETYRRGMGPRHDIGELLTPRSRSVYEAIQEGKTPPKHELPGASGASESKAEMPKPGADGIFAPSSEQEFNSLPSGAAFRKPGDPPDKVRVKP